ncbi:MAG TPA: hypothetical protein VF035_08180 [Longimicrobiales bacterium]
MTRCFRITFAIIATIAGQGCTGASGDGEDRNRRRPPDEDRQIAAVMLACEAALVTDMQRVVTKKHKYGGGVMCAAPGDNLDTLTFTSYTPDTGRLVAFVEVVNANDGYEDNGFRTGRNCIYLKPNGEHTPQSVDDLEAFITYPGAGAVCPGKAIKGRKLEFAASDSMAAADVPPVVRLDMNYGRQNFFTGRRTVVSFKCLPHHWCRVSRKEALPPLNEGSNPRQVIAGWFDEQYLSMKDGNELRPSEVYASIYPVPGLDALVLDTKNYREWVNVAEIRFRGEEDVDDDEARTVLKHYTHKWGFDTRTVVIGMKDVVTMQMRYDSLTETFEAHYVVGNNTGVPRPVKWVTDSVSMHMLRMPIRFAATRWAWDDKDEYAWVRCPAGCCSVTEVESGPVPGIPSGK